MKIIMPHAAGFKNTDMFILFLCHQEDKKSAKTHPDSFPTPLMVHQKQMVPARFPF